MITAAGTLNDQPVHVIGLTQDEFDYLQNPDNSEGFIQITDEVMNVALFYAENDYILQEKMIQLGVLKPDDPNL